MPLASGDHYAGYRIVRLLGAGCTGTVYLAIEADDGVEVALKIVRSAPSSDPGFQRRFRQTNDALQRLNLPGAARLVGFGELRGRLWAATEYASGSDADYLVRHRFPSGVPHRSTRLIAADVARTLDAAHDARILHRDVKPTNILLDDRSSEILLTDFGHGWDDLEHEPFRYAAPEMMAGTKVGPRSDQFALAATVFHLLTGRPAFGEPNRTVAGDGHVQFDERALADVPNLPEGLQRVFARAFAFDPKDRFDSCSRFADAVRDPGPLLRRPATGRPAPEKATAAPRYIEESDPPARKGRSVAIPAAIALAVTAAIAVGAVMLSKPHAAPKAAGGASAAPAPAAAPEPPSCQKLDAAVNQLNRRDKLAQLLMVGVQNLQDAQNVVRDQNVGGIMIGSWTDLSMLTGGGLNRLEQEQNQGPRPLALAVSVDEEGGRVSRLKNIIGVQPSPRDLVSAGKTPPQVREIAKTRGLAMKGLGITIDFAPVVDTTDADADTVIGDRSFSDNPDQVTAYAGAYADGLRDAGILPVLKHFPGHGHASGDSHKNGVTTYDLSKLKAHDLIPYITLTQQAPVAVMVGHMVVPGLTDGEQASLSAAAYDMLRKGSYGQGAQPFTGLIFTDDLSSMKAISNEYGVPAAVLKALQAGADTALWITTAEVPAVLNRLEKAIAEGDLTQERVDDAVRHVALAKDPTLACTR